MLEQLKKVSILWRFLILKHYVIYISASYQFSSAIFCCIKLIVIQHGRHKVSDCWRFANVSVLDIAIRKNIFCSNDLGALVVFRMFLKLTLFLEDLNENVRADLINVIFTISHFYLKIISFLKRPPLNIKGQLVLLQC